ncbi:MAG: hypothetical protein SFW67_34520 [Myxococcaceae bacterium]|nr:hypothetical protein [Myxococcaceae bacterium]
MRRLLLLVLAGTTACWDFDAAYDRYCRVNGCEEDGGLEDGGAAGGTAGGTAGGSSGGTAGGVSGGAAGGSSGGVAGGSAGGVAGGSSGGASGGAAGGSSGGAAGGSAGGVAGGAPLPTPCDPGRGRLLCDAPIALRPAAGFLSTDNLSAAADDTSLIVAWVTSSNLVTVSRVFRDGGTAGLFSHQAQAAVTSAAVSARGGDFAVGFIEGTNARCFSSADSDAGLVTISTPSTARMINVSVNGDGGVGAALASTSAPFVARSEFGCPRSAIIPRRTGFAQPFGTFGSVDWHPALDSGGFRYSTTGTDSLFGGAFGSFALLDDGGVDGRQFMPNSGNRVGGHAAVMATTGASLNVVRTRREVPGGPFTLVVDPFPTLYTSTFAPMGAVNLGVGQDLQFWNASRCGAQCLAVVATEGTPLRPSVRFLDDDTLAIQRAQDAGVFDVTCSASGAAPPIASAWFDRRLGIAVGSASQVTIHWCERP